MNKNTAKSTRHAIYDIHVHLVFVVKCRRKVLTSELLDDCERHFKKVCEDFGAELEEFNGEDDHAHLLVNYPPQIAISSLVNSLKGVSSRRLRADHPEHVQKFLWGDALWSRSYYCGTAGGAPLDTLAKYISEQDRPKD